MKRQRSLPGAFAVIMLLAALASACGKDEQAVKGRNGPNGTAHDSVSDVALSEEGIGPIQIGMNMEDAVNMGCSTTTRRGRRNVTGFIQRGLILKALTVRRRARSADLQAGEIWRASALGSNGRTGNDARS